MPSGIFVHFNFVMVLILFREDTKQGFSLGF